MVKNSRAWGHVGGMVGIGGMRTPSRAIRSAARTWVPWKRYLVSAGHPELTSRHQIEGCAIRQFFEKDDRLVRFVLDFPFVVTDSAPLPPFASASEVGATREAPLPDLFPMNAFAGLHPKHVYRHENNFPVADPTGHPAPHTVLGFGRERCGVRHCLIPKPSCVSRSSDTRMR